MNVSVYFCSSVGETLNAVKELILLSLRWIAWKVPLWLYCTTPTLVPVKTGDLLVRVLQFTITSGNFGIATLTFGPVSDCGSLAKVPSLLMVLMTKFFSKVKLVSPTDSELSITKTMSTAPQRFSQSGDLKIMQPISNIHKTEVLDASALVTKLTAAATRLSDVVHDITFLQANTQS